MVVMLFIHVSPAWNRSTSCLMEVRNKYPSLVMLLHGKQWYKTLCAYRFRGVADFYPMVDILYINIAPVWKSGTSCLMEVADLYPSVWCYGLGKSWKSRRYSVDAVMCGKAVNLHGSCSAFVAIAGDYGGWANVWFCGYLNWLSYFFRGVAILPTRYTVILYTSRYIYIETNNVYYYIIIQLSEIL